MFPDQIGNLRLRSQQVTHPTFTQPEQVVAWMGAMQGQGYAGIKWSVGLRMLDMTDADIERALAERRIVRTWALRGTLHVVAAEDLHWISQIVAERVVRSSAARYRELEITDDVVSCANAVLERAVAQQSQSRDALFEALNAAGIATTGQRGVHLLHRATFAGILCQSTTVNHQSLFYAQTLLDHHKRPVTMEEALAKLAERYFLSHSPATLADFCRWAGIGMREARQAVAAGTFDHETQHHDGRDFIVTHMQSAPPMTALLSDFDEFILGYENRNDVLHDPSHFLRIVPGGNGVFYPTVVVDGRVIGTWKRVMKRDRMIVQVNAFVPFTPEMQEQVLPAARRCAAFYRAESVEVEGG